LVLGTALGALWFLVFVAAHVALFHLRPVRNRSRAILIVFGCCLLGELVSVFAALLAGARYPQGDQSFAAFIAGPVIMVCGFILYMPLYYTITTSLSIQTLIAIELCPGGACELGDLKSPTVYRQLLQGRLDSMVTSGNLDRAGAAYRLTPKGRVVAQTFAALKDLWRLGPGG
jgi:hypothetical protein